MDTQIIDKPTVAEQYGIEYRGSLIGRIALLIFTTLFAGLFIGPLRNKHK